MGRKSDQETYGRQVATNCTNRNARATTCYQPAEVAQSHHADTHKARHITTDHLANHTQRHRPQAHSKTLTKRNAESHPSILPPPSNLGHTPEGHDGCGSVTPSRKTGVMHTWITCRDTKTKRPDKLPTVHRPPSCITSKAADQAKPMDARKTDRLTHERQRAPTAQGRG